MQTDPIRYRAWLESILPLSLQGIRPEPCTDERYWPEVEDYTMSSGFAMTPRGRIWLAWFGGEDNEEAVLLLASSDDGGKTFSHPRFVLDGGWLPHGIHRATVVGNVWIDPLGRLWVFYMLSVGYFDGRGGTWAVRCDNPDSDQPVWGEPRRIWHGCALNKPTVLADGSWLLPIYLFPRCWILLESRGRFRAEAQEMLYRELDPERGTHIFISKDQGETWEKRGCTAPPVNHTFDEPMVVERADGSFLMYLRTEVGIVRSESSDRGMTWTVPRLAISAPSSRFFLTKLASGNLLLVRNANPEHTLTRSHLTAFISTDDGETWSGGLLLDDRSGISYPDGFQTPDGRIFIQYDRDRASGEILMSVFTEADAAAGKAVSGAALFRQPIMRSRTKILESGL